MVAHNNLTATLMRSLYRGTISSGHSLSVVRDIYHLVPQTGDLIVSRIHVVQRYVCKLLNNCNLLTSSYQNRKARTKTRRATTDSPLLRVSVVRELIPFHTFSFAVHWPTPPVAPSPEWRNLFCNMYAIDLWRLEPENRQLLCSLTVRHMRITGMQKLRHGLTPDGFAIVAPTAGSATFQVDAEDEKKVQEILELLLQRPYIRLCLPYFIWLSMFVFQSKRDQEQRS